MRTLTPDEAKSFYDKFGDKQDTQAFYEDRALRALAENSALQDAKSVFEFGCGTGRFAAELIRHYLPATAQYLGVDISSTMAELAADRLAPFASRAFVAVTSGEQALPVEDASVDRFISTYVFDLLSDSDQQQLLAEARRILHPDGLLCLTGITNGVSPLSHIVMGGWRWLFARKPFWVGGCRPSRITEHLFPSVWKIHFHTIVVAWGVASQVVIASPLRQTTHDCH